MADPYNQYDPFGDDVGALDTRRDPRVMEMPPMHITGTPPDPYAPPPGQGPAPEGMHWWNGELMMGSVHNDPGMDNAPPPAGPDWETGGGDMYANQPPLPPGMPPPGPEPEIYGGLRNAPPDPGMQNAPPPAGPDWGGGDAMYDSALPGTYRNGEQIPANGTEGPTELTPPVQNKKIKVIEKRAPGTGVSSRQERDPVTGHSKTVSVNKDGVLSFVEETTEEKPGIGSPAPDTNEALKKRLGEMHGQSDQSITDRFREGLQKHQDRMTGPTRVPGGNLHDLPVKNPWPPAAGPHDLPLREGMPLPEEMQIMSERMDGDQPDEPTGGFGHADRNVGDRGYGNKHGGPNPTNEPMPGDPGFVPPVAGAQEVVELDPDPDPEIAAAEAEVAAAAAAVEAEEAAAIEAARARPALESGEDVADVADDGGPSMLDRLMGALTPSEELKNRLQNTDLRYFHRGPDRILGTDYAKGAGDNSKWRLNNAMARQADANALAAKSKHGDAEYLRMNLQYKKDKLQHNKVKLAKEIAEMPEKTYLERQTKLARYDNLIEDLERKRDFRRGGYKKPNQLLDALEARTRLQNKLKTEKERDDARRQLHGSQSVEKWGLEYNGETKWTNKLRERTIFLPAQSERLLDLLHRSQELVDSSYDWDWIEENRLQGEYEGIMTRIALIIKNTEEFGALQKSEFDFIDKMTGENITQRRERFKKLFTGMQKDFGRIDRFKKDVLRDLNDHIDVVKLERQPKFNKIFGKPKYNQPYKEKYRKERDAWRGKKTKPGRGKGKFKDGTSRVDDFIRNWRR